MHDLLLIEHFSLSEITLTIALSSAYTLRSPCDTKLMAGATFSLVYWGVACHSSQSSLRYAGSHWKLKQMCAVKTQDKHCCVYIIMLWLLKMVALLGGVIFTYRVLEQKIFLDYT